MDIDSDNDQTAAESLELQIPEISSPATSIPPLEQLQPDREEGSPLVWVFLWIILEEVVRFYGAGVL